MRKYFFLLFIIVASFSYAQSDCISAIPVCGDSQISYTPSGHGLIDEELGGCMSTDERFTVWYTFTIGTSGTLTFTITPNVFQDDYDFAVYGPNIPCSQIGTPTGQPIRCNYSGADGPTGLSPAVTHPAVNGQWSGFLNVIAGETYYLVIDNFSQSSNGFTLDWGGTAILNSPFDDATIQPNPFVEPGPNNDGILSICSEPSLFDFATLSAGIINGNTNFTIAYFDNANDAITGDNPIITPINVNSTTTYHYAISYTDPANPNNPLNTCKEFGTIDFDLGDITANNVALQACNNNESGVGIWDLTTAVLYTGNVSIKYYPTIADANANTNEITSPTAYQSSPTTVYGLVTTQDGCSDIADIDLIFYPVLPLYEDTLVSCFIEGNFNYGLFDLNLAYITDEPTATKTYFSTYSDAVNNVNPLTYVVSGNYLAQTSTVYVRVQTVQGCWNITKINLQVTSPDYSSTLVDKYVCFEDRTILDAGPGYDAYQWSTGEKSQSINVGVGEYTVELFSNNCTTTQTVKVMKYTEPVITNIDIENDKVTITAVGGTPPYKYSADGITWQDQNVFTEVPRGQNIFYVKDINNCEPLEIAVTVPNLINVLTPNGDNVNDVLDYSALSYKRNLVLKIYDRYGNLIHTADRNNGFRWDGKTNGREILTGTYWYHITWNEPNTEGTQVKFSGWIVVKNRD